MNRIAEPMQSTVSERRAALRPQGRMIGHTLLVVPQSHIHEDIAEGGLEADHQCFGVFTGLVTLLGRKQERRMYAEMESLIIQGRDGVAHNLVREFEDGFLDQR